MFLRFLFFAVMGALAVSAQMGGWKNVDTTSKEVTDAATFAINIKLPDVHPKFKVVTARQQVVAGMKYDLHVEVTNNGKCEVDHFEVWNRFGTLSLVTSDVLRQQCSHRK